MSQGYDFGQLFGRADMSSGVRIDEGVYDAVTVKSTWGKTKDGTKGQWTAETVITTGQYAGTKFTNSITVSPVKNDGEENTKGMGAMFRHLRAHGIPVPPQPGMPGGFWELGWSAEQVAQAMVGKPVQIVVKDDEYDGVTRSKIRDYQEPRPGAPAQVQLPPQQPAYQNGYGQQPQYAAHQPPPGYGQGGQAAPGPWQNTQQPPQAVPGAPEWAQPAVPGAGGLGEFTGQGQSYQPGYMPPPGGGGAAYQPGYDPGPVQGGPGYPPQQPSQQYQQPGYPPQQQQQQQPPQGYGAPATAAPAPGAQYPPGAPSPSNGGQPAMPPWAQQGPPQQGPPQDQAPGAVPAPPWAQ